MPTFSYDLNENFTFCKLERKRDWQRPGTGRDRVKEKNRDTTTARNVAFERIAVFVETKAFMNFNLKKNCSNKYFC